MLALAYALLLRRTLLFRSIGPRVARESAYIYTQEATLCPGATRGMQENGMHDQAEEEEAIVVLHHIPRIDNGTPINLRASTLARVHTAGTAESCLPTILDALRTAAAHDTAMVITGAHLPPLSDKPSAVPTTPCDAIHTQTAPHRRYDHPHSPPQKRQQLSELLSHLQLPPLLPTDPSFPPGKLPHVCMKAQYLDTAA